MYSVREAGGQSRAEGHASAGPSVSVITGLTHARVVAEGQKSRTAGPHVPHVGGGAVGPSRATSSGVAHAEPPVADMHCATTAI